ncbi:HAMP domain-containing histidine kinase [Luteolibacter pohnpeiensis]|uniref:histidine kinase n=1 Tax=Luteolibacter pohnpeiensis TaxID=454153 RepID=A0A934SA77_9BACT|nr:HAMP domain-containing sensor histidine kinase [Luteolibacter pohnpeiensis]MBK1882174.1 HAMP domain-containing histidine kinase [Luteolibacter pohnpeiensis]
MKHIRFITQPGGLTILIAGLLAACVLTGGLFLSRKINRQTLPPVGNQIDDSFRQAIIAIDEMEPLWQQALEEEADISLKENPANSGNARIPTAVGVIQRSYLIPSKPEEPHAHASFQEHPTIRPVLEKHEKNNPAEWVFEDSILSSHGDFIRTPGKPLAYAKGNRSMAVILILDPTQAGAIVFKNMLPSLQAAELNKIPGSVQWVGPDGKIISETSPKPPKRPPDETLRHVSSFGDWQLKCWFPIKETVIYQVPSVTATVTLTILLISGGFWSASNQRKAAFAADQRVSFVNRVSHELRSPLTNILLNTDVAIDQSSNDEKLNQRLRLIREETGRLGRIVDNVLTFAKLDHGCLETQLTLCDPSRVIREILVNFAPLFGRKGIHYSFENDGPDRISIAKDVLTQIISNLLSNVEKYAGLNAKVSIQSGIKSGRYRVQVCDDSPGIPREAAERIFLPFERVYETTTEGASGTGLGLAISRELAIRAGGTLDLLSTTEGASFELTLPCSFTHDDIP